MSFSRISEIMSDVIHVHENDPITKIIDLFENAKISGAPVINDAGKFVGVLSKTDIVSRRFAQLVKEKGGLEPLIVRDLMNPKMPITVKGSEPLDDAIALMDEHQVHRIFVTDETDRIIGTVTTLDVVSSLRYSFESYL